MSIFNLKLTFKNVSSALLIITILVFHSCSLNKNLKQFKEISIGDNIETLTTLVGESSEIINIEAWNIGESNTFEFTEGKVYDYHLNSEDSLVKEAEAFKRLKIKKSKVDYKLTILDIRLDQDFADVKAILPNIKLIEKYSYYKYKNNRVVKVKDGFVASVNFKGNNTLAQLDKVRLNFGTGNVFYLNIALAFIMFGVALGIRLKNFKNVLIKPKAVIGGILSQFFLLPFLTFIFVMILKPTPSIAMGMILVAACPGGNMSNFFSSMAKGNIELSVTLTAFATLAAVFMTPINFSFWGSLYSNSSDLIMPIQINWFEMVKTVVMLLGIPIVLGIGFKYSFPRLAIRLRRFFSIFSIVFFVALVSVMLAMNYKYFSEYIGLIFLIVLAHNILAFLTGFSVASALKLDKKTRRSITIETGIQNSGLGLVLIFNPNLFDGIGGMAFIAAWWGIWHIISGLMLSYYWSKISILSHK